MPTIAGLRRRGYTPASIRLMCDRAGTSKAGGWTDYASLEIALRDDLEGAGAASHGGARPAAAASSSTGPRSSAARRTARRARHRRTRSTPSSASAASALGPHALDRARRLRRSAGQGLLSALPRQPGAPEVRLRRRVRRAATQAGDGLGGRRCRRSVVADTKSGTPGADAVKVKGTITWLGTERRGAAPRVRLYDRLFSRRAPRCRRQGFPRQPQPGQQEASSRGVCRVIARRCGHLRGQLPVRGGTATSWPIASITAPGDPVYNRIGNAA